MSKVKIKMATEILPTAVLSHRVRKTYSQNDLRLVLSTNTSLILFCIMRRCAVNVQYMCEDKVFTTRADTCLWDSWVTPGGTQTQSQNRHCSKQPQ